MKTITFDEAIYKLVPVEPTHEMTVAAYEVDRTLALVYAGLLAAVPAELPGVVTHNWEPIEYQTRMRPNWLADGAGWSEWKSCSAESFHATAKLGTYNDWEYEVRELFTHPPAQPDTAGLNATLKALREKIMDRNRTAQFFKDECAAANVRIAELDAQLSAQSMFAAVRKEFAKQTRDFAVTPEYCAWLDHQAAQGNEANGGNEVWNAAWKACCEAQLAAQAGQEPVLYVNGDDLLSRQGGHTGALPISMLRNNWYKTPLYAVPPAPANSLAIVQAALEAAACESEYFAEMMEQGAGELGPGDRLRQTARKIRAITPQSVIDGMSK